MITTKYHTFKEFEEAEFTPGIKGQVATQLMRMYNYVKELKKPSILELGTSRGASTTIFLQACEETDGQLVSVDINDCSDVSNSNRCTFIQSDSTDVEYIISKAKFLKDGIDVLYIDSLHKKSHVERELNAWYPFMNAYSHIFLDDVDSNPYRKGQRKDDFFSEVEWNKIRDYVISFFHSNESDLYLDFMFGTTGLAHLYKLSPQGSKAREVKPIINRENNLLNKILYSLKRKKRKVFL